MNTRIFYLLGLILILSSCEKKAETQLSREEKKAQLSKIYEDLYDNQKFNGNVLVAEKGDIIFENSYGLANEEDKIELNLNTRFELASVSKQFTAMGIVQLQKEGKLSYSDPISTFIPELSFYNDVTVENLLNHTGGLTDYMMLAMQKLEKSKILTNEDIIKLFKDHKPNRDFQPNEKYEYSNTGYLLLASIIERASGKTFEEYLKEKIFTPLDMQNTFVYRRRFNPRKVENYAEGYIYSEELGRKIIPDEQEATDYVIYLDGIVGDGMVSSNIYDLLKWDRALYKNDLVNEKDKELIFSSYPTKDGEETNYGFGWKIENHKKYKKIVSHSGSWAGYLTYIERHLDNDKTVIVLQNNDIEGTTTPIESTRRTLYSVPLLDPVDVDPEILKSYVGTYIIDGESESEIIFKDGKIWFSKFGINLELIPVSNTKFMLREFSPTVYYTFILDENNEVIKYHVLQEGESEGVYAIKQK